jgi:hypothetical protein
MFLQKSQKKKKVADSMKSFGLLVVKALLTDMQVPCVCVLCVCVYVCVIVCACVCVS